MDSVGDVEGSADVLKYYAGWSDKIVGQTIPVGKNCISSSHFILSFKLFLALVTKLPNKNCEAYWWN